MCVQFLYKNSDFLKKWMMSICDLLAFKDLFLYFIDVNKSLSVKNG